MTAIQAYQALLTAFNNALTKERDFEYIHVDIPATDILVIFNDSSVYVIANDRKVFAFPRTEWSVPMLKPYAKHVWREIFKT